MGTFIKSQRVIDGVIFNPKLPRNFDCTQNSKRPNTHYKFIGVPYIRPQFGFGEAWLAYWHTGVRYDVLCLDGGCWDRPTWKGSFQTLDDAVSFIKENYTITKTDDGFEYTPNSSYIRHPISKSIPNYYS